MDKLLDALMMLQSNSTDAAWGILTVRACTHTHTHAYMLLFMHACMAQHTCTWVCSHTYIYT
jgi:hypothetical protein